MLPERCSQEAVSVLRAGVPILILQGEEEGENPQLHDGVGSWTHFTGRQSGVPSAYINTHSSWNVDDSSDFSKQLGSTKED